MCAPETTLNPLSQFIEIYDEIPRNSKVLVVCHTGQRSMQASLYLACQGYAHVDNVRGGMDAWTAARLRVDSARAKRRREHANRENGAAG